MLERLSVTVGSTELSFETGRIAKQAHGSVICRSGDTMVLSAVCVAPDMRPGQDFFPMTVDYREKSYAAGRIPGSFFRREARPSEREVLVCRMTDRPLRPLFPKEFLNELQVCQTVLSADNENNPDVLSINAASAALHISKIPFLGPIAAVRVGRFDGELVLNPTMEAMESSEIDVVMAGTKDAVTMVEGQAKMVSEEIMLEALAVGHAAIKEIIKTIEALREKAGVEKMPFKAAQYDPDVVADVEALCADKFKEVISILEKAARYDAASELKASVRAQLKEKYGEELYEARADMISEIIGKIQKRVMRMQVIETHKRIDGRGVEDVRPITIEVGVLPRAHGSALFTRGETQAIVTTTLGTSRDELRIDELEGDTFRRFFLHYNFPSWSVGEVRRMMGPGRREIGHGKLAERALMNALPHLDVASEIEFPYTTRIVSEVTESNGSSSMATICGGSLSLMDAGAPIASAVAGIAMGLIKEGDEVRVLSDILGDEDHLGDMDFKVAGTKDGITAFQMDVKIPDVTPEIMAQALEQAKRGRDHILEKMNAALAAPREEMSPYAPRITTIKIAVDKIRDVIGSGGKIIREIQAQTGTEIDIQDDGTIRVAAVDGQAAQDAVDMIKAITADVEVGQIYHGTVVRLMDFGAFVSVTSGKDGLVHISALAPGRVDQVTDVVDVGDEIDVKVMEIDSQGRVNLSKVEADYELGRVSEEDMEKARAHSDRGRRSGGGGDRDRGGRGGGDRGGRGGGGRGGGGGNRGRRDR